MTTPQVGSPEAARIAARRQAIVELGAAVRALTHAVVDTEVDDAALARAAALATQATAVLTTVTRPLHQYSPVESPRPGPGRRVFSPIVGFGNPVSPPVTVVASDPEGLRVVAAGTLHRVHEGPPTYGHGGMSAMLLDQILGQAVMLTGQIGLTRSLEVRYRRPVPLGVPLVLTASVTSRDETRIEASGRIATEAAPEVALVEAVGTFVQPRPEQVRRLFGHVERAASDALPTGD